VLEAFELHWAEINEENFHGQYYMKENNDPEPKIKPFSVAFTQTFQVKLPMISLFILKMTKSFE
jgi:hypothetical protein